MRECNSLNSHVNGSNFSVAFDSRVRAGTQGCMVEFAVETVFYNCGIKFTHDLLAALMMLDARRQLHDFKTTLYYCIIN